METIIKIAKTMKKPLVYITPNYIYGSDTSFDTMSIINNVNLYELPQGYNSLAFNISSKIKMITDQNREIAISPDFILDIWENESISIQMMDLSRRLQVLMDSARLIKECEFSGIQNFNTSLKLADRHQWSSIDNYMMSNFNTIHPVNQSDTGTVSIYDLDLYTIMGVFHINKKKYTIDEYIRFRKL